MRARHHVRGLAQQAGLRLIDQTKIVTAVSELARNTVVHGGGGHMSAGITESGNGRRGVWAAFEDDGPGIADTDQALREGFSTGSGLGLGLGGARRLVHQFEMRSTLGEGTTVRIVAWR